MGETSPARVPHLRVVENSPVNSTTDGQLCLAFLEGDTEAFGQLMKRHQRTVFNVVRRYVKSSDDALDVVQRAFLQAFEAAARAMNSVLVPGGEAFPFRAWVLRIALNLAKNAVRDAGRRPRAALELVDTQAATESAQVLLEKNEAQALVREAVLSLSPRQSEVFSLRVDGELSFAEVGATLGITEVNAKTHFHQAVKRLKELVAARTRDSSGEQS